MKLVIAQWRHETNTFSPVPTPIERFARGSSEPLADRNAYDAFKGTGSAIGAFLDLADSLKAEIDIPVAGTAWPSGPATQSVYETLAGRICDAVSRGCDAILLDLHGAMVTEALEDGEGELLTRLRRLAPRVPIGVALDMHTNMYPAMVENATVIAGYQTYPHIDFYETGMRAGKPILSMLEGKADPVMVWGNRPMLPHIMRQSSEDSPNRELQARARAIEGEGALAASLFTGFPHADIANAGVSSVVVGNGNRARAQAWVNELLDMAWAAREDFVYRITPLQQSLASAAKMTDGPVVLLDHYDNAASGGTMDTMTVLEGILTQGFENVAVFAVFDPDAVQEMVRVGVGARVSIPLGGKLDMPSIGLKGKPLTVEGNVKLISNGLYRNRGPNSRGVLMDMGTTVVLDTGKVEIVVISRHQEPNDLACFQSVGIDITEKRYIMLKSRVHWRAGFKPFVKAIVDCAGTGVCTSDYGDLTFRNVRRPIFPLDRAF